jgi:hypothetical protein
MAGERQRRSDDRARRSPRNTGMSEVAAAVRRRQRERGPRVLVYDPAGHSRAIAPSAPGYDELLGTAERMIGAVEDAAAKAAAAAKKERAAGRRRRQNGDAA